MTSAPKEVARVCAIPGLTRKQLPIDREGTVASAQLNGLRICGCNWLSCLTDSLPQIQGMPIIFFLAFRRNWAKAVPRKRRTARTNLTIDWTKEGR